MRKIEMISNARTPGKVEFMSILGVSSTDQIPAHLANALLVEKSKEETSIAFSRSLPTSGGAEDEE